MSEASQKRYLACISEQFPTVQSLYTEIINLKAILNLPKGTEHFMSDIHGEYDAFLHILNNCSGVVREKALLLFSATRSAAAISDLLTLIYYPKEKLKLLGAAGRLTKGWYNGTLHDLIELEPPAFLQVHALQGAQGDAFGLCLYTGRAAPRPAG